MPVHRLTGLLPWLLFNIPLLFKVVNGRKSTVYSSLGETVNLPCNHDGPLNCSSITWTWNSGRSLETIELVILGEVNHKNQERFGRLSVGAKTKCSLRINNLITADAGKYYCRQYQNEQKYSDAPVTMLSLLNIFPSPPATELRVGSAVTLVCDLHSPGSREDCEVRWVSETGDPLQGDRYKLSKSECSSSLTVTLKRSDRYMKWICQLNEEGDMKASVSYTITFPDEDMRDVWIVSGVTICVALVLIVGLIMICRRRSVQRKMAHSQSHTATNQDKGESEDTVTYAVINPSAGGKRKSDQRNAAPETEYAMINTSQK